jgi:hypothetical protein
MTSPHVGAEVQPFSRSLRVPASPRRSAKPFRVAAAKQAPRQQQGNTAKRGGLAELGPIGMTFGGDDKQARMLCCKLQRTLDNCNIAAPPTVHIGNVQAAAGRDSDDHAAEQSSVQRNGSSKQEADSSNGSGRSGSGFGELGPIALSFAEDQHDRFGRCVATAGLLPTAKPHAWGCGCCFFQCCATCGQRH